MIINSDGIADRLLQRVIGVAEHADADDDRTAGYTSERAVTIALRTASAES